VIHGVSVRIVSGRSRMRDVLVLVTPEKVTGQDSYRNDRRYSVPFDLMLSHVVWSNENRNMTACHVAFALACLSNVTGRYQEALRQRLTSFEEASGEVIIRDLHRIPSIDSAVVTSAKSR